jgi:hypothetical protein
MHRQRSASERILSCQYCLAFQSAQNAQLEWLENILFAANQHHDKLLLYRFRITILGCTRQPHPIITFLTGFLSLSLDLRVLFLK